LKVRHFVPLCALAVIGAIVFLGAEEGGTPGTIEIETPDLVGNSVKAGLPINGHSFLLGGSPELEVKITVSGNEEDPVVFTGEDPGTFVEFIFQTQPDWGNRTVTIVASDKGGNSVTRIITIRR